MVTFGVYPIPHDHRHPTHFPSGPGVFGSDKHGGTCPPSGTFDLRLKWLVAVSGELQADSEDSSQIMGNFRKIRF